ncbi:hypothetical protein VIGAN_04237400 [Vigna angularis var. angularis]|uniref:Uncharacterized protein n=1 Tax=Vigna angularis var. angularis TaxID=157739 RepID=A0A0S3RWC9_PHAAN|nr:hypothetical protein VIGAN_04237400 [Vigna angularis var. angularis]
MTSPSYPDLVKVLYANARVEDGIIVSRVRGIDLVLSNDVWTSIAGFGLGGMKSHKGFPRVNILGIFQACLRCQGNLEIIIICLRQVVLIILIEPLQICLFFIFLTLFF